MCCLIAVNFCLKLDMVVLMIGGICSCLCFVLWPCLGLGFILSCGVFGLGIC